MLDIAICDDNFTHLESIEQMIVTALFDENELNIDLFDSDEEFADIIKSNQCRYDIVFIDIHLNNFNGLQLADMIRKYNLDCEIVFVSADSSLVFSAFSCKAFDYLVKPLNIDMVANLFERFRYYHNSSTEEYFSFKSGGIENKVKIDSIVYFYSNGRKITIVTEKRHFEFYSRLDDVENLLIDNHYIRIHQSYLINPRYVKYIISNDIVMENDDYLPISRNRHKMVREKYLEYLG